MLGRPQTDGKRGGLGGVALGFVMTYAPVMFVKLLGLVSRCIICTFKVDTLFIDAFMKSYVVIHAIALQYARYACPTSLLYLRNAQSELKRLAAMGRLKQIEFTRILLGD